MSFSFLLLLMPVCEVFVSNTAGRSEGDRCSTVVSLDRVQLDISYASKANGLAFVSVSSDIVCSSVIAVNELLYPV